MVRSVPRQGEEEDCTRAGHHGTVPKTQDVQLSGVERSQSRLQKVPRCHLYLDHDGMRAGIAH